MNKTLRGGLAVLGLVVIGLGTSAYQAVVITANAKQNTYRLVLSNTATLGSGVTLELSNPAGSGKMVKFRRAAFNSSAVLGCQIQRFSTASTGGTSSAITVAKVDSGSAASVVTGKLFTVAPTAGNLDQTVDYMYYAAAGRVDVGLVDDCRQPIIIRPGEFLCLVCGNVANTFGFIEWTEENQ